MASNPFDDAPSMPPMSHMNQMNHLNKHMGVGPCMSPAGPPMMGSMSPCHMVGPPMPCGPRSPISCGPPMGNCSPMGGAGNNANCGPVGSPHTGCNSRQVSRSPLVGTPMNANSVMGNGPMNSVMPMNRSPSSLGSPLSSVMAANVRGNSPLDCGLSINSVGSQKGSPMSVMGSHNINLNCGSPMGSPSNVPLNNCNNNMMGSPIPSPLSNVPCSLGSGGGNSDLGIHLNNVMNRSPHSAPPPNSVSGSMMCNPAMRGPSPISGGPMNGPMSMNCNPNPSMMNPKPDMNMNDLALREGCGPGHLPMKPNNGPGGCGMPVNNISCSRPSDFPMNGPHCGPMMNNQCGPNMSHGPCMGNGMNRAPCPPGMGMNLPFDGMNPQFRPAMNRSQFPRGMTNIPYGPNSMNGPMNGPMSVPMNGPMNGPPMNSPMNNPMNGPNMSNMCGPSELNSLPGCGPNNASGLHCVGDQGPPPPPHMNNVQCMNPNAMNQCPPPQPPNSMFNPPYSPFDVNNPRCSPNMNFHPNDMNVNNNFYRSPNVNNAGPGSCIPNMHPSVVGTSANDVLGVTDSIVSNGNATKNDPSTVDSDIASVVCGITHDTADDLNLLGDELLRDTKPDEQQQRKSIKDFGDSHLLLGDDVVGAVKDEELDSKPNKAELDAKVSGGEETKRDAVSDKRDASTPLPSSTSASLPSSTCTTSNTSSSTTTNATVSGSETTATTSESGDLGSKAANGKSGDGANDDDDFVFKNGNSGGGGSGETLSNTSAHSNSNAATENDGSTMEDVVTDDKIKNEPAEEKLLDGDFHDDDDSGHHFHKMLGDDKNDANSNAGDGLGGQVAGSGEESGSSGAAGPVQGAEKETGKAAAPTQCMVKMEGDELFDSGVPGGGVPGAGGLRKNDCSTPSGGMRPGGNGFTGPNVMAGGGPPVGFNVPSANDLVSAGVMPNSASCMNDALCSNPMLPNMGRSGLPHNANHAMNFPNRNVCTVRNFLKSFTLVGEGSLIRIIAIFVVSRNE